MSYTPTTWTEAVTKLGPTNMNHLEVGLQTAASVADAAIPKPAGPVTNNGLVWNGSAWVSQFIANASIDPAAAIAYSKLNLAGLVVNNDIAAAAAIAWSKLNSAVGGWAQLYDTTLGGTQASIVTSALPATYAHLRVVIYCRGSDASARDIWLRINADTGSNYDYQLRQTAAASVTASEGFAQSVIICGFVPGTGADANLFSSTEIDIPHYAGTANNKNISSKNSYKQTTTSGNLIMRETAGFWRSNAAISTLTLLPSVGSFVAGTRVTVYGMG